MATFALQTEDRVVPLGVTPAPGPREAGPQVMYRLSRLLPIIAEMVSDIETLTLPGQRRMMAKVAQLISDRVRDLSPAIGARNEQILSEMTARLSRESERICPDVQAFNRGAEGLLALLRSLA
ncbi:MAG TPA: hypothetical protein VHO06_28605 [Polyangia bacterium]|nr:hypothetical protein [Polyangia bacterium]